MFKRIQLLRSALRLIRDPQNLDEIFRAVESLAAIHDFGPVIANLRATSPRADRAFRERVRVAPIGLAELAAHPAGSLGRAFADHCAAGSLDPSVFFGREVETDLEYLTAHLYETHDIWHVVAGIATDVDAELGLQAFYLAQFPSQLALLLLPLGLLRTLLLEQETYFSRMDAIANGWQLGKRAAPLIGLDWTAQWHRPLADIRAELGIAEESRLAA